MAHDHDVVDPNEAVQEDPSALPTIYIGVVGILGIPEVNLGIAGQALSVGGTAGPDLLSYTPTAAQNGSLMLAGRGQVLNFDTVGGVFTLDPLGGSDQVTVIGTVSADMIIVVLNTITTVQVNALLTVEMPIASVERVATLAGQGVDVVHATVFDAVNANLTVDGGVPSTNPKRGDLLVVRDGSGKAKILTQSSAVKGSGSVLFFYHKTTLNRSRVDYVKVEKVSKKK